MRRLARCLAPLLVYLLLSAALRRLLSGYASPETAAALCPCILCLPVILWYRKAELPEPQPRAAAFSPWPAVITLCLAVSTAAASRLIEPAEEAALTAVAVLGYGIAGPIIEELLYRGTVLRRGAAMFGRGGALLLTTALFGVAHVTPWRMVLALAAGLVFGLIYLRRMRLGGAIAAHIAVNLFSFLPYASWERCLLIPSVIGLIGAAAFLTRDIFIPNAKKVGGKEI